MKYYKYSFKFKRDAYCVDEYITHDDVITTSQAKAFKILKDSYNLNADEVKLVKFRHIDIYKPETTCNVVEIKDISEFF